MQDTTEGLMFNLPYSTSIHTFCVRLWGNCVSRFGSFEIFKRADENSGRQGPSYGHDEIRGQMLDYVIETFYPEIQQNHSDRVERNVAFFREVCSSLDAQFQNLSQYTPPTHSLNLGNKKNAIGSKVN